MNEYIADIEHYEKVITRVQDSEGKESDKNTKIKKYLYE